jgi:hypothetical protein
VKRIRSGAGRSRQQPRIGAPDPVLTPNAGLAAVTGLCDQLGVIGALDAAVGPIKERERGFGAGELLAGLAAAQLAGEEFLTGLDRQRADAAGQQVTPVPVRSGGSGVLPADQYVASLARKRMAAGALFRDGAGRPLLVDPVYKDTWDLPGGAVEAEESPHAACRREVAEELGLDRPAGCWPWTGCHQGLSARRV